jgi:hypothetical protein
MQEVLHMQIACAYSHARFDGVLLVPWSGVSDVSTESMHV